MEGLACRLLVFFGLSASSAPNKVSEMKDM
jgi:hypothetical protein